MSELKSITIKPAFNYGEMVYLVHDPEKIQRMVLGYVIRSTSLMYELICGVEISHHYVEEISFDL